MKCQKNVLANDLRLLTIPMPSVESATLTIWTRTGSRFENKKNNGISHFLEHMVFKGSKRRPTAKEVAEAADSLGAEFNAATDKEYTLYYLKARAGVISQAFDLLSDIVLYPLIKKEDLKREKGVILEELAMYEDTPMLKIGDYFENLIFPRDSLGWDVIGTRETIKGMERDDFTQYINQHYYPKNMLITVAGGIKEKEVLQLAQEYFSGLKTTQKQPGKPKKVFKQTRPQVLVKTKKTDQAHLILGFRGSKKGHPDRYVESVLTTILGQGMSSRMFTEVREKRGLAYAVKSSRTLFLDNGYLGTYAGVPIKKAGEAIKVILNECQKITHKGNIQPQELKKAKELIKGRLALSLESTNAVSEFFGQEELFLGKTETPEQIFKKIDLVKGEEVIRVAKKIFRPENLNLAIVGPYQSQTKFETILQSYA